MKTDNFFTVNNILYGITDNQEVIKLNDNSHVYDLPLSHNISLDSLVISFNEKNMVALDASSNFKTIWKKTFDFDINSYDVRIVNGYLYIGFNNDTCTVLNLLSFNETTFSQPELVLLTNGISIISLKGKNTLVYQDKNIVLNYTFKDTFTDILTNSEKNIRIKSVLYGNKVNSYIIQADYNYLYYIEIHETIEISAKVIIPNTFLGDTTIINYTCYHITNRDIYKIDFKTETAEVKLNWTNITGDIDYSGIKILHTADDCIIFMASKKGTIMVYDTITNAIISHTVLNNLVSVESRSLIIENILYINDIDNITHSIKLPLTTK